MISQHFRVYALLLFSLGTISACSIAPPVSRDESARLGMYQIRADRLAGMNSWSLEGRLAINDGHDGGSGRFKWKKHDNGTQMEFHGALGRGAWRLAADSVGATLETADGTVHRADDIEDLVRLQVGWEVPVEALSWWARGLAAPAEYTYRVLDENGNLSRLEQNGWVIRFDRYRSFDGIDMPVKVAAHRAEWTVKLAAKDWILETGAAGDD